MTTSHCRQPRHCHVAVRCDDGLLLLSAGVHRKSHTIQGLPEPFQYLSVLCGKGTVDGEGVATAGCAENSKLDDMKERKDGAEALQRHSNKLVPL